MKSQHSAVWGFIAFLLVFIAGLAVNGLLGLSGFESVYRESLIRQYNVQGEFIKGKIETSLNFGKKMHLLADQAEELFYEAMARSDGIEHIYITDTDSNILYSTRSVLAQNKIPFDCYSSDAEAVNSTIPYTVSFLDSEYICIPLYHNAVDKEGYVIIEFAQQIISSYIVKTARKIIIFALSLLGIFSVFYLLLTLLLKKHHWAETLITILLLLASQLTFTWKCYATYNTALSAVFNKNMTVMAKSIAEDLQKPLEYVGRFEELSKVPDYLASRIAGNPQCSDIYITDSAYTVIASNVPAAVDENGKIIQQVLDKNNSDYTFFALTSLSNSDYLVLKLNRPMIAEILRDMALDSGTIIIVALLFAFILKDFFLLMEDRESIKKPVEQLDAVGEATALRLIKVSTFFFMFAAFETLSFIPLLIQQMYQTAPGIFASMAASTVISLPVSSYMLGIMLAMFMTIFILKNYSIKKRYVLMSSLFIAGSVFTIAATDMLMLIIARFIAGFGFGGVLLSTSSLVIQYTNSRTRSQGFGTNAAASASASIASISVGGVISSKFGYAAGIGVAIVFAFFFLLFSIFCIEDENANTAADETADKLPDAVPVASSKSLSFKDFSKVLWSRHVLSYILCINIPFQLIYVGLFQFLLPIYMSDTLLLSQGNIGRILCIFSIVSLAASYVSRLADRVMNDKLLISIGAVCVGIVMIVFNFWPAGGFLIFFALMFAMGIDNVFIDAVEEVYVESGQIKGISEENILQCYKTIEKILSIAIPTVTSIIIINMQFAGSMLVIGSYSLVGALLFLVFGRNGRQKDTEQGDAA